LKTEPDPSLTLEACFQKWEGLFASAGVELGSETGRLMSHYLKELKLWNRRVSLVSFASDEELLLSHLADSLMAFQDPLVQAAVEARAVDIGTGGGFPGVPLRLARPGWSMALLESVNKKTLFLDALLERLPLKNCAVLRGRAEDLARDPAHRGAYDLAFCRAVGRFSTGLELALPLLRVGGAWIAHRGADAPAEIEASAEALKQLGGEVAASYAYRLPHLDRPRHIVRVRKTSETPDKFPRRAGMPAKRPL
jgi:16S rRNA (guanine527-N7)-methyltransferase